MRGEHGLCGRRVTCCNRHLYYGEIAEDPVTFTFIMPRLAIVAPHYDAHCTTGTGITFRAVKSAGISAPLGNVAWLGDGAPATGGWTP